MRGVGASMLGAWVAVQRQYVGSLSGGVCLGHVFHILHMVGLGWWCGRALVVNFRVFPSLCGVCFHE